MKKSGFTLIEVLAVIIIIAIIALIVFPSINNVILNSQKKTVEESTKNIINAARTYYMNQKIAGRIVETIDLSSNDLEYRGDKVTKGYILFGTNGNISSKMYINGYCVTVDANSKIESEKLTVDACDTKLIVPLEPQKLDFPVNDGEKVYFNPVTGGSCNKDEVINSATDGNDGCMKWYAFLDDESNSTIKLILGHNTTTNVAWTNNGNPGIPVIANAQLQEDVTNWDDLVKSTARLITVSEITQIAPSPSGWTTRDYTGYYFHTSSEDVSYEGQAGTNNYAWLFDKTNNCESYGCYTSDNNVKGYWTSSYAPGSLPFAVDKDGRLMIDSSDTYGVRPVIEVSKEVFK